MTTSGQVPTRCEVVYDRPLGHPRRSRCFRHADGPEETAGTRPDSAAKRTPYRCGARGNGSAAAGRRDEVATPRGGRRRLQAPPLETLRSNQTAEGTLRTNTPSVCRKSELVPLMDARRLSHRAVSCRRNAHKSDFGRRL